MRTWREIPNNYGTNKSVNVIIIQMKTNHNKAFNNRKNNNQNNRIIIRRTRRRIAIIMTSKTEWQIWKQRNFELNKKMVRYIH